ncbi:MAG: carbohydrate kinase family protein, partial [Lachnospiraceae bacterium]|nr:carbohydrate kinase family protein [Lachnospiraceae bacterium]
DIFHIGYLLLMPALDAENAEYGTNMAKLLHRVQQMGIKTSIDVISEAGEEAEKRFRKIVTPALKYTDYCVINELEAQNVTGVILRDSDDKLHVENFRAALEKLKELGVGTWAVIHCPEIGAGLDENGNYVECRSLKLPKGFIKGSTGAGDAFCAGVLYAAEKELGMAEALKIGACTAAASLSEVGSIDGVRPLADVLKLYDLYGN